MDKWDYTEATNNDLERYMENNSFEMRVVAIIHHHLGQAIGSLSRTQDSIAEEQQCRSDAAAIARAAELKEVA